MTTENPSAFPVNAANLGGPGAYAPDPGMSLRDWFAGQAATMPAPVYWRGNEADPLGTSPEAIARRAYAIADAMLAERAKAVS